MIRTTSDIKLQGYKVEIKFPDISGTLLVENKEGRLFATWRNKVRTIERKGGDEVIRVFLPDRVVRIFEAEVGGEICVDYELAQNSST